MPNESIDKALMEASAVVASATRKILTAGFEKKLAIVDLNELVARHPDEAARLQIHAITRKPRTARGEKPAEKPALVHKAK